MNFTPKQIIILLILSLPASLFLSHLNSATITSEAIKDQILEEVAPLIKNKTKEVDTFVEKIKETMDDAQKQKEAEVKALKAEQEKEFKNIQTKNDENLKAELQALAKEFGEMVKDTFDEINGKLKRLENSITKAEEPKMPMGAADEAFSTDSPQSPVTPQPTPSSNKTPSEILNKLQTKPETLTDKEAKQLKPDSAEHITQANFMKLKDEVINKLPEEVIQKLKIDEIKLFTPQKVLLIKQKLSPKQKKLLQEEKTNKLKE